MKRNKGEAWFRGTALGRVDEVSGEACGFPGEELLGLRKWKLQRSKGEGAKIPGFFSPLRITGLLENIASRGQQRKPGVQSGAQGKVFWGAGCWGPGVWR